jgi:hypothetical protein
MKPSNHHSDEDFLKIVRSNPAGHTTVEIADKVGVNPTTALHHLRRLEKTRQVRSLPIGRRASYNRGGFNPRALIWIMPPDPTPRLVDAIARNLKP